MLPSRLPQHPTVVAFDTETSGLHPDDGCRVSSVSVGWYEPDNTITAYAFPFDQGQGGSKPGVQPTLFDTNDTNLEHDEWRALCDWLSRRWLVCQNAPFDVAMMRAGTRHFPGIDLRERIVWDTQLCTAVLEPLLAQGLKEQAAILWGFSDDERKAVKAALAAVKPDRKTLFPTDLQGRYDLVNWNVMEAYSRMDAVLTIQLCRHQHERLIHGEVPYQQANSAIALEHALMDVLTRMQERGMHYDADRSREIAHTLRQRRDALVATLPFEPTLHSAKRWFFDERKYIGYTTRTKNGWVLDDEVVQKMVRDELQHADTWSAITKIDKACSMWYDGYANACGHDGRLRTVFRQTKVKTGRMAVERVQLHAIPKVDKAIDGVPPPRSLFRASKGNRLWNLDLSQAELRVAARYSECTTMLEDLVTGADFHGRTCQAVLHDTPGSPTYKTNRDIAKRLTFGSIFLIGGRTFQSTLAKYGIERSLDECTRIVHAWRHEYPEFSQIYYRLERYVQKNGYVWLLPIDARRQRHTEQSVRSAFTSLDFPNTAWSRVVQGSLAQFNKHWLVNAQRWLDEMDAGDALVLNVHDSLVLDTNDESVVAKVAECTNVLATEMFNVPMHVDISLWYE